MRNKHVTIRPISKKSWFFRNKLEGSSAIFAKNGIPTIGVDINLSSIKSINKGQSPFFENGLDKLLSEVGGKTLIATNDYDDAISKSNLTYILTATPSNQDGSFSNEQIESALISSAKALKKSNKNDIIKIYDRIYL